MRNPFGPEPILKRAYNENVSAQPQIPCVIVPALLDKVRPVHEFVKVDMYLPGCPPSADTFYTVLSELLAGRTPDVASLTRFGA
jgi:NAD-reducing hydrogenase small subunit